MNATAVAIETTTARTPIVEAAEGLLLRRIEDRTGITPVRGDVCTADILLAIREGLGEEGFRIEGEPGAPVRITGNDGRGLIYGVGKFLRDSRLEPGSFTPGGWRGRSVPVRPVRGIYFATHFHNWYHVAPPEDVVRYVEDLALWGCNALVVWFDLAIYKGIDDLAARKMVARLHAILAAAQRVGIRPGLLVLANEGFSSTPVELRATNRKDQNGYFASPAGFYGVEVCPSAPGGMGWLLQRRGEVLDAFGDIAFEYFVIWPYDQGGCTCASCAPWGHNGYLRTAEAVARMARARFPKAKIVLSTWYFDHFIKGEWDGLRAAFADTKPDWVDYLLIDDYGKFPENPLTLGIPGGFPVVGFAEISMVGMYPWGGFGANPRPRHWQAHHQSTRHLLSGGFPYSEGIYEDLNKVLQLQLGWAPDRDAQDIVREYAAAHLSAEKADDITAAVFMMEELLGIGMKDTPQGPRFEYWRPPVRAEECRELVKRLDSQLPDSVRRSWRWRILLLRAVLDAELKQSGGKPTAAAAACWRELTDLYHAHHAVGACHPPVVDGNAGAMTNGIINEADQAGGKN